MTLTHRVSTMGKLVIPKKIVLPIISADTLALPGMSELHAFAQQMTDKANANYEECRMLSREIARLKKAKKKASRAR